MKIKILDKNGITLNTKNTICDEDIDIVLDDSISNGINPTGTINIISNGVVDVTHYANANVQVPSTGITPSGTYYATSNGTYDVTTYASVNVNVPIPSGYIKPSGTYSIENNGEYNISQYEKVSVNVANSGGSGSGEDMLQKRVDATQSCEYLFSNYKGTQVDYIINLDISKCTNLSYMFYSCKELNSIPQLNTSKATNMRYMFSGCLKLTTIPLLNTSNVTDMAYMFESCRKLNSIPQLNTSKVTDMSRMFMYCTSLTTIPELDTSNVTDMFYAFYGCSGITHLPNINMAKATTANGMFNGCSLLQTVTLYNTENLSNISGTFSNCRSLYLIDISCFSGTVTSSMCSYCYSLKAFVIRGFGTSYALDSSAFNNCYHILGTQNSTYNPTGAKDGYIYVPRNMIATLSTATNWSTHASQLRALEDYTLDGTTTGELDWAKMNGVAGQSL